MSSILDEPVCLDTNQFVFGIRSPDFPACNVILRREIRKLTVFLPLEVVIEIHRNRFRQEVQAAYRILRTARDLIQDFTPVDNTLLDRYESMGAKDGDARICAHLHTARINWLISDNRDFLHGLSGLPFAVLSSSEALAVLTE